MYYAVLRKPGPAWVTALPMRSQQAWAEHASFMDALADDGFIVLGGPVADGTRFLFLVRASREEDIRERLAADPWVPMEMLQIASIEPWQVLLGDPAER
jgi:uncharacterized protein YciI